MTERDNDLGDPTPPRQSPDTQHTTENGRDAGQHEPPAPTQRLDLTAYVIMMLVGLGMLIVSGILGVDYWHAKRTQSWPSTQGSLLDGEILIRMGRRDDYAIKNLRYNYKVDGRSFEGTRYNASTGNWVSKAEVEHVKATLRVGGPCTVYYNPDAPDESLLNPGGSAAGSSNLMGSLGMMVVGLGMIVGAIRLRRPG